MDDSHITITDNGGMSFVGADAVDLYRVMTLRSSIDLHRKCGLIPTRGVTITKMFKLAGQYTGQTYKRGQHERAIADLTVWIETMKSALPIEKR
jgi:hypothetical protein